VQKSAVLFMADEEACSQFAIPCDAAAVTDERCLLLSRPSADADAANSICAVSAEFDYDNVPSALNESQSRLNEFKQGHCIASFLDYTAAPIWKSAQESGKAIMCCPAIRALLPNKDGVLDTNAERESMSRLPFSSFFYT
jgi:hypothetical protein